MEVAGLLEGRYADCPRVTLVCDNLNTHTKGAFYEVFEPVRARELVRRLEFCYTPKHGSWLNIAENELSAMTRQCLSGRRIGDLATLHGEVSAWSSDTNDTQRGVDWQMKVDDARCKVESTTGAVAVGRGGSCSRRLSPMPVPHSSPWLRFQSPLVEPDMRISRIRLSDEIMPSPTESSPSA